MPRPRINPDMHRKNVAITINPVILDQARQLAAWQGNSLSQVVDKLLQDWMKGQSSTDSAVTTATVINYGEGFESRQEAKVPKILPTGGGFAAD